MARLVKPWAGRLLDENSPFGPNDCLLSEYPEDSHGRDEQVLLMKGGFSNKDRWLYLHPYPKRANAVHPLREGFLERPKVGQDPRSQTEERAHDLLRQMNEVLARIQELEEALDDPEHVWSRLRQAWHRAENEEDPRMAEIVRQSRDLTPVVRDIERRIRRVLRRDRELTPIDRVQEMDRASMVWLSRQPGTSVQERAGSTQRIMATVRRENFDTLENRVFFSYLELAGTVAREWLRAHPLARESARFRAVEGFRKTCRKTARALKTLGVTSANTGITPNYVLMQDRGYSRIYDAWLKLLLRDKALDDMWAWQAQAWTDFAVLAIVLALDELKESELIAQSPILWRSEAITGRWFDQDRPIAVFWLRDTGRIVEVQARPEAPGALLSASRAHVALLITDPNGQELPRRVAVWTPHTMNPLNIEAAVSEACNVLIEIQNLRASDILRNGLIITPALGPVEPTSLSIEPVRVDGIALGPSGKALTVGLDAMRAFARSSIY